MLVAQAQVERLMLVTVDDRLAAYGVDVLPLE
jgi:PIN domain nuclease of toxin-antitoxin system